MIYPNNGDTFKAETKEWLKSEGIKTADSFAREALTWKKEGGNIMIGGCCRIDCEWITTITQTLRGDNSSSDN